MDQLGFPWNSEVEPTPIRVAVPDPSAIGGTREVLGKLDELKLMFVELRQDLATREPSAVQGSTLSKRARRKAEGLTHLYCDRRTGIYRWKRIDDTTGKRMHRSTKTTELTFAIQIGAKLELEYQRRRAGLAIFDDYKKALAPAAEHWIRSLEVTDEVRMQLSRQIARAMRVLKLVTFADLDDIQRLERNLLALEGTNGPRKVHTKLSLRNGFQKPLKQFSKWCAQNRRYLPQDPLVQWALLRIPEDLPRRRRRAVAPAEMARALLAAETLDRLNERQYPTGIVFLGLLVTGSRFGALAHLEVPNIVKDRCRLDLGPGVGKKRKGDASLDARTYTEIMAYVRERTSGPIFLSPTGERLDNPKALDYWREAFTFALVDEFWPDDAPRTLDELYVVTRVLVSNKMPTVGGNPLRLRADTIDARQREEQRVRALAERVRPAWHARMLGIDLHALRKTHRTWAEAAGVHPILIDKQIGHSTAAGSAAIDAARSLLVSPTGRKHYVDMGLDMIDAKRSAEAVRKILDDARIEVLASTKPSIFSPASTQPPAPILDLQAARAGG